MFGRYHFGDCEKGQYILSKMVDSHSNVNQFLFLPIGMSKHICIQPNETFIEMWSLVSLAMR